MRQGLLFSLLFALLGSVSAQFNFFEQMFGGGGGGGGQQHHQQQQQQNAPSDSAYYRSQVDRGKLLPLLFQTKAGTSCSTSFLPRLRTTANDVGLLATAYCSNYLCPDTLACVHFPHHCPCPWPSHEDKFELGEGHRVCVSKGGFKAGEAARKVELARKGLL